MSLQKGDIVLVPFPFTDLSQTKLRPAVVLWVDRKGNDATICFISSQSVDRLASEEFLLDASDLEFSGTGLRVTSKVRVSRVVTLDRSLIVRRLGRLGVNQIGQLNAAMLIVFQLV